MPAEDRAAMQRARREHDLTALQPTDPEEALDATTSPSASACS
jgi:hypothetical protein